MKVLSTIQKWGAIVCLSVGFMAVTISVSAGIRSFCKNLVSRATNVEPPKGDELINSIAKSFHDRGHDMLATIEGEGVDNAVVEQTLQVIWRSIRSSEMEIPMAATKIRKIVITDGGSVKLIPISSNTASEYFPKAILSIGSDVHEEVVSL